MQKTLIALAALTASQQAYAQAVPDIEGSIIQGNQIGDVIADKALRQGDKDAGAAIDGEAGVYVLKLNEIFFIGTSMGVGYSTNPLRTVGGMGDSFSMSGSASAGIQTRLGGAVDFGLSTTVSGVQYLKSFAPSSRNVNGVANVGTQIGNSPLYLGLTGFGGYNYDKDFKNGIAFYGASATLGAGFPIGKKTILQPGIGVVRQWSKITENNSVSTSGSVRIIHALDPRLTVAARANISRVWFDNFYEDVTFVKRKDWQYGGGVDLSYRLTNNLSVSAAAGVEKRDSAFFLAEYKSLETALLLSLRINF